MENKRELTILVAVILMVILSIYININTIIKQNEEIYIIDTTYNTVTLDSIKYNIIQKDSIIYNYKEEMYEEIKKNSVATNDDVIRTFYQLVAE